METPLGRAEGKEAVKALAQLTNTQIIESEKTKRYLMTIVLVLFALALVIPAFVPGERDTTLITIELIVLGLGAIGVQHFVLKAPGVSIQSNVSELREIAKEKP
jgi:hypothetical protein